MSLSERYGIWERDALLLMQIRAEFDKRQVLFFNLFYLQMHFVQNREIYLIEKKGLRYYNIIVFLNDYKKEPL